MATCRGCTAEWTSLAWAHCSSCHRTFYSVTPFDTHRQNGRCRMKGLVEENGVWGTPEGHEDRKIRFGRSKTAIT